MKAVEHNGPLTSASLFQALCSVWNLALKSLRPSAQDLLFDLDDTSRCTLSLFLSYKSSKFNNIYYLCVLISTRRTEVQSRKDFMVRAQMHYKTHKLVERPIDKTHAVAGQYVVGIPMNFTSQIEEALGTYDLPHEYGEFSQMYFPAIERVGDQEIIELSINSS